MSNAWELALARARKDGVHTDGFSGRFRVIREGRPIPEISGRSAAGAGALGWYLALREMVPDEDIIVMADVRHDRDPLSVGRCSRDRGESQGRDCREPLR